MPVFTVVCGFARYYTNTVETEADDLDQALQRAIEIAGQDDGWKAIDYTGPVFVDAAGEGADDDPWVDNASALPIPDRFTEFGEPPRVTVAVKDGIVGDVEIDGHPVRVIIKDYTSGGLRSGPGTRHRDDDGALYKLIVWGAEKAEEGGRA